MGSQVKGPRFDRERWEWNKVRNRLFQVRHLATGRIFEIEGHPRLHRWKAVEIVEGSGVGKRTVRKPMNITELEDCESMRRLLIVLDDLVVNPPSKRDDQRFKPLPWRWPPSAVLKENRVLGPTMPIKLELRVRAHNREEYFHAPTNEVFILHHRKHGWDCENVDIGVIANHLPSKRLALKALAIFLTSPPTLIYESEKPVHIKVTPDPEHGNFLVETFVPDLEEAVAISVETEETVKKAIRIESDLWEGYGATVIIEYEQ